ncbi:MAG TPA: SUMF1/EgtB/PvdO family nonheme iron enzyme [Candidatus Solibacter sp.]|nr:SUMF1/EgtB/PvdO family nonheme iron enzyme [Candidatus Solibacter sp.]
MLATPNHVSVRHELLERLFNARRRSDELFSIVRTEALYERPIPERHRIIFYIGHLEAFDANLLRTRISSASPFHPEFDRLFAFGIDPVGGGLPSDQPKDWPAISAVRDYVTRTRRMLDEALERIDLDDAIGEEYPLCTLLNVAVEHRLMHVETLAYMFHRLPLAQKIPQADPPSIQTSPVRPAMIPIPSGNATLGLNRSSGVFGWDNEFEEHSVEVSAFEIDNYKVTNQQYLEFMQAGGYERREWWSEDDWRWRSEKGTTHPAFWVFRDGQWFFRGMFEEVPLPPHWPVYVSHVEASAYARWAGKALPTEEQWHRAAYGSPDERPRLYPWGDEAPTANLGNFDLHRWNPTPVNAFPDGQSAYGVHDLLGNGWEWTSTVFSPFPGFKPFPFYRGYSADFFDGKHFVMKGGSMRTAACMLRPSFRNWFQGHYPYVYAGFRCVNQQEDPRGKK